jgi:hypothetical protein
MPDRKELLIALEKSIIADIPEVAGQYEAHVGTWKMYLLNNSKTVKQCQIFECVSNNSIENGIMPLHYHEESQEVFYQLVGNTTFSDGIVINPGEVRILKPKQVHSCILSPDGVCIVIVHPPIPSLLKDINNGT